MPRKAEEFSDDEIGTADVLMLVDPARAGWQQLLWSAEFDDETGNSETMKILELVVDSRNESQVAALRARVGRLKGGTGNDR